MTAIELAALRKEFGDVAAVDGIDMTVRDGEFLVIVGPSGCGKSTTLRTVAGLEDATAGAVRFGDRDVTAVDPEDRDVAMVFQNYALFPHMTARQNMSFGAASATGFTDEEIDARVAEAAATLDVEGLLDRTPDELSGGEQQRVAIGRALVRDPDVLLMDEPLSNLDAKLRTEMRTELQTLHADLDTTTVYVTHDQTEAMTLGDRVAVMRDGAVEQVATPQALYDYPTTRFVAEFIGSPAMNTLPVAVRDRTVQHEAFSLTLPGDPPAVDDAVLGVRPEDFHPAGDIEHTHEEPLALEARVTEPLGDTRLVHGSVAGREVTVAVDPHRELTPGETVEVVCDPARVHLFDPDDGRALYHSGDADASSQRPSTVST